MSSLFPTFTAMLKRNRASGSSTTQTPRNKRAKAKKPFLLKFGAQEQAHFAKRLAMILRSGIPIMEGMHMMSGQLRGASANYIYSELIMNIEQGQALSHGMKKFEKIFGEFTINIVRVGETSGTLHENLDYLAEELKKKQALKRKVLGALVYPAVIVCATVGISLVLTVYIFPKITPIFASFKATLPLSTRILMAFSNFLLNNGLWVFIGAIALTVSYFFLLRVRSFHLFLDKLLLKLPLFGTLSRYYNLANLSRTLGLLLKSDVGIVNAVEIVSDSMRNLAYKDALKKVQAQVMTGQRTSVHLAENPNLFPPMMTQMVQVGEQTGNLAGSLMYLSQMYEEEINDLTKNMTTLIEPVLMVVMGIIVGFIAISIITPIYGITQEITPYK